ncbi:hypothetical protein [Methylobacterium brachiatum]|uniref:hypothetical protein n=1 Tax=Methylobacterium brachiatum TaxID=269660 RepID=UPI0008E6490C|nr:hypothetical protein [Methylobacterium brachiatum]SFI05682.1 hypothetical protein SAMN02799642_00573 [Methylobacterium brachiatum]
MDTAHVFVALAGDRGNSVPKMVTPAEIQILQRLHGDDAVHDILPAAPVQRSKQQELGRLAGLYPARDEDGKHHLQTIFPSHTLLPMTLDELGLPDALFRATTRARPATRTVEMPTEQTHGAPDTPPVQVGWDNTQFEPIDVPADPETQPELVGTLTDPSLQHRTDEAPGTALQATEDGTAAQLRARAEAQGTGPGAKAGEQKAAEPAAAAGALFS